MIGLRPIVRRTTIDLIACAIVALAIGCAPAVAAQSGDSLVVRLELPGKNATRSTFFPDELKSLPRDEATVDDHGQERRCSGVQLSVILEKSGLSMDRVRGELVSYYVLVNARDDYRAVFSLAEVAPDLSNGKVLLVDTCDGSPLSPSHGPLRIIATGDSRPTRWVRQVATLIVRSARP